MKLLSKKDAPTGEEAPRKKAIQKLLALMLRHAWELIQLNVVFLLCCIPVVTIGAAVSGLTASVIKMARGNTDGAIRNFFRGFRSDWKDGTVITVVAAAFFWCAARALRVYWNGGSGYHQVLFVLTCVIAVLCAMALVYLVPLLTSVQLPLWAVFKNAFILAAVRPLQTLAVAAFIGLWIAANVLLFPLSLPVLLLVGVSIPVFCQGFVAWSGIRQFVVQEENAGEEQPCV